MLRQMPRKALDFPDQRQRLPQPGIGRVEPDLAQAVILEPARGMEPPQLRRHRGQRILGQAQRAADLADRPLAAIVDDRRAQARAVPPVAVVDVLDHLLAPLVLEIDVDVGGFVPRLGHEALEHHRPDLGGNRRHPQRIADDGIRRRPPPLAQDAARPGERHHVVHRQEIGLVAQLAGQRQLVVGHRLHPRGHPARIAPGQPLGRQPRQPVTRRLAAHHLGRVFIAQLIEREGAARRHRKGLFQRPGPVREQPRHLSWCAQPRLGIGQRGPPQPVHRHTGPDRRQHIGQPPA